MSPQNRVGRTAQLDTPAVVVAGRVLTVAQQLEEMSAVPASALDKISSYLVTCRSGCGRWNSLSGRSSQPRSKGLSRVRKFGSISGSVAGNDLQTLRRTPHPQRSPNVSPATYFRSLRAAYAKLMIDQLVQVDSSYGLIWRQSLAFMGRVHLQECTQVFVYQLLLIINLCRYTNV